MSARRATEAAGRFRPPLGVGDLRVLAGLRVPRLQRHLDPLRGRIASSPLPPTVSTHSCTPACPPAVRVTATSNSAPPPGPELDRLPLTRRLRRAQLRRTAAIVSARLGRLVSPSPTPTHPSTRRRLDVPHRNSTAAGHRQQRRDRRLKGADLAASPFTATSSSGNGRPAEPSDNGRLSGTTRAPASDYVGSCPSLDARLGHVIRYICCGGAVTGKILPLRERSTSTIQAAAVAFCPRRG